MSPRTARAVVFPSSHCCSLSARRRFGVYSAVVNPATGSSALINRHVYNKQPPHHLGLTKQSTGGQHLHNGLATVVQFLPHAPLGGKQPSKMKVTDIIMLVVFTHIYADVDSGEHITAWKDGLFTPTHIISFSSK